MTLPLLLLHAITRDAADFGPFLPSLPPTVVPQPVDLLGHGNAPRAAHYSLSTFAAAVPVPDGPFALYGHSLGGVVALALAAGRRAVKAVVLEDPPLWDSQQPRLGTTRWAAEFAALHHLMVKRHAGADEATWRTIVGAWPSGHGDLSVAAFGGDAAVARRARQIASLDPAVLTAIVSTGLHADVDVLGAIRTCPVPVFIIFSEREHGGALAPEDLGILSAEQNVTLVRAPGAGHYVRESNPALCAGTLMAALP